MQKVSGIGGETNFFERRVERNIRKKETKIKLKAQDGRKRKRQQKERKK